MSLAAGAAMAVLLATCWAAADDQSPWIDATFDALEAHLQRHPEARAEDVYKFLFQAVLGPGHAVPSRDAVAAFLEAEVSGLGPAGGAEPLCEPLGGSPALVRIHLRPLLAAGGDLQGLVDAFVTTAEGIVADRQRFDALLTDAPHRLQRARREELASALSELAGRMREEGLPALHHSQPYRTAYRPAYRVVSRLGAEASGWCDPPGSGGDD